MENVEIKSGVSVMNWYVVRTQANREKSVLEKLIKEGEKGDMMGKIGRVLVPMEKSFFLKNGKKISREKVMYPCYVFVETNAIGELKYFVKGCNGASGLLSNRDGSIQVLKNCEVDRMIGYQEDAKIKQEIENKYIIGEDIKIIDGPFNSFSGTVENVDGDKVKVGVLIFGRKTLVELGINQIDK